MAKPCFYHSELAGVKVGEAVELSAAESSHALQSRRLTKGSQIQLLDGQGWLADASIEEVGRRSVSVVVSQLDYLVPPAQKIHCVVAMPKGDRQKAMVDALTQLGVSSLTPLQCDRAISIPKDNQLEKLKRVSLEACKQSKNPHILNISAPQDFKTVITNAKVLIVADQFGKSAREVSESLQTNYGDAPELTVLIGPEGGFSKGEFDALAQLETLSISVGQHILRTETAAIALTALLKT
ncbi:MAG: 16S rRNA (uracil(1498)-N(3))-methyltransferase [Gammaproteobacteria bacterium]|nr:16S rRNA (uracil(1498)-N(3))-methyltransferase [Gammaproteobacteria bacterium]